MSYEINRRDFIKLLGAGAAGASIAGCAQTAAPGHSSQGRVVIVGAGYGGATAAKYIRMWSGQRIDVTVVERNSQFISCPLSNLVLGGSRALESLSVGYDGLRARGVQIVQDDAVAIDVEKKRVRLERGGDLSFDRLIVSP